MRSLRRPATWLPPLAAAACACLLAGCGGGDSGPAATPEAIPQPEVRIAVSSPQVTVGQPATLTWSATNATACTASGSWTAPQPTSGSFTFITSVTGSSLFRIDCTGPGGTAGASAVLLVLAPPAAAGANVMPVVIDRGPDPQSFNMPFVSVTICSPGSSNCRTVDRILLDTGSVGLRVMASVLDLGSALPAVVTSSGLPVAGCGQFVSGFTWGSIRRADVKLGGGLAAGIPIQLIGDPSALYATVPAACRATGFDQGSPAALGANGILGISMFVHDCSTACLTSTSPRYYYTCTSAGCAGTPLPLESQVTNPVAYLAGNNNGLSLAFPPVPVDGATTVAGTLTFGLGSQPNNQIGTANVLPTDARGNFSTIYRQRTYATAFIDSGSNGLFFDDPSLPVCGDFYCPLTALALSAVNRARDDEAEVTVSFIVDDINALTSRISALNAAGPFGLSQTFDWGIPFFFGRKVFLALQGAGTPWGTGPYWAY